MLRLRTSKNGRNKKILQQVNKFIHFSIHTIMLNITKQVVNTGIQIWQSTDTEVAQGGFTINDAGFISGDTIPAGTPIAFDEQTRFALVAKVAVVTEAASNAATAYKVKKGHLLKSGSQVKVTGQGAQAIIAIDKTNADYDIITVGTTIGKAVAIGDAIYVDDAGATAPGGLSFQDITIGANGIASVTVATKGTVYARRIVPVPASIIALLVRIRFSQSY